MRESATSPFRLPQGWTWAGQPDVFSIQGGAQPAASTFVDSARPGYVRLVQIRDYYTDAHLTYVPDSPKLRKCSADDVMIARYGSSGGSGSDSLARICRGIAGAYNVALVRADPRPGVDRPFLYYLLQSRFFQDPVRAGGARSVQSGFNRSGLKAISLPKPPLDEQRRIAGVLGALDDLIEGNERLLVALDCLANTVFRNAWDGEATQTLSDVGCLTMGQSPPGHTYNEQGEGLPFHQGIRDFTDRFPVDRVFCAAPTRLADAGDILIAVRAPVGVTNVARRRMAIGRGIAALKADRPCTALHALRADPRIWSAHEGTGTVFSSINKRDLLRLPVPYVDEDDLENRLGALDSAYDQVSEEIVTLKSTRDELLPLLMSGAVSPGEVEVAS